MNVYRDKRRGQVMIMITLGLGFLLALGALAIDMTYIYAVKVRLGTAVDSTTLGVARALGRGTTAAAQQAEIERVANMLFASNFPPDLMLTKDTAQISSGPTVYSQAGGGWVLADPNVPDGMREIRLTGETEVPTFFARLFGHDKLKLSSSARAARRDVNIALVLDRSGSMMLAPGPPWPQLQDAAKFFVDQFDISTDRVALITFGTNARVDYAMNYTPTPGSPVDFKTPIGNLIDSHVVYTSNRTNSPQGFYLGYRELENVADTNALNAIVFFTDGQPTATSGIWHVRPAGSPQPYATSSPIHGVIHTGQTLSDIEGVEERYATGVPAQGTGSQDFRLHSAVVGSRANVEQLLLPTLVSGLQPWQPEWPGAGPSFPLMGPNAAQSVDTSGTTLVSGTASQRGTEVRDIAENLTLEIASAARNSIVTGGTRVYSIGLGGYLGPAREDFLKSLANTEDSPAPRPSEPQGLYVYAPGPGQLRQAFQTVANEIFRLIQ